MGLSDLLMKRRKSIVVNFYKNYSSFKNRKCLVEFDYFAKFDSLQILDCNN